MPKYPDDDYLSRQEIDDLRSEAKASKFLNDELSTNFKYPGLKMGRNFVSNDTVLRENLLKL